MGNGSGQMTISKNHQIIAGIVWLLVFPFIIFVTYTYFPMRELEWGNLIVLFVIVFLTMMLPIKIQDITITLERWVTLTIFLQYGVFAELLFVQAALLILLLSQKTSLPLNHKFFVNSIVFSITSLVSGIVYYFIGGAVYSLDFTKVFIWATVYGFTYTLVNNAILKLYFKTQKRSYSLLSRGPIWDYITTLLMVPFGVAFYFLDEYLELLAVLLIGVPFLLVLYVMQTYMISNRMQGQLSLASEIGHNLANELEFDEILKIYIKRLKELVPYDNGYVVDLRSQKTLIPLIGMRGGQIALTGIMGIQFEDEKTTNDGLDLLETKIFHKQKEIRTLRHIKFDEKVSSVMTVPVIRNQITEGFLILTAKQKNVFQPDDIPIFEMLTGYLAIALQNARHYEEIRNKSEQCGLTNLPNYRYFDRKLEGFAENFHENRLDSFSIVMLDIDHFKMVNDTYGHESGNVVLIELAKILKSFLRSDDIVARYGGEEFVFILHECSKENAVQFAEEIRLKVARTSFRIIPDLFEDKTPIDINITISLGVASVPRNGLTAKEVLRSADRALYIGAKQAGRNKVGVLDKGIETQL